MKMLLLVLRALSRAQPEQCLCNLFSLFVQISQCNWCKNTSPLSLGICCSELSFFFAKELEERPYLDKRLIRNIAFLPSQGEKRRLRKNHVRKMQLSSFPLSKCWQCPHPFPDVFVLIKSGDIRRERRDVSSAVGIQRSRLSLSLSLLSRVT